MRMATRPLVEMVDARWRVRNSISHEAFHLVTCEFSLHVSCFCSLFLDGPRDETIVCYIVVGLSVFMLFDDRVAPPQPGAGGRGAVKG